MNIRHRSNCQSTLLIVSVPVIVANIQHKTHESLSNVFLFAATHAIESQTNDSVCYEMLDCCDKPASD